MIWKIAIASLVLLFALALMLWKLRSMRDDPQAPDNLLTPSEHATEERFSTPYDEPEKEG